MRPALLSFFSWGSDSGFPFFRLFYEERQEERARRQHGRRENNRRRGMMIEDGGNPAKRPVAGPPVDDASAILRAFEPTRVASDGDRAQGEGGRCARRKGKVRGRNLTLRFVLRRGRSSQLSSASSFSPASLLPPNVAREVGLNSFLRPGPTARTLTSFPLPSAGREASADMIGEARNGLFPQMENIAARQRDNRDGHRHFRSLLRLASKAGRIRHIGRKVSEIRNAKTYSEVAHGDS